MQAAMESGLTTSEDLVMQYLSRIAAFDDAGPMLNAILHLNPGAVEIARSLDEERSTTGPRGPLHGIPVLLKDNIDTFDQPTTAGALILAGSVPPDDAFLTQKLRDAGAVILGKGNLTELSSFISTTIPPGFSTVGGLTLNPYGLITPSGSSAGSAVSVAANLAAVAVGTETQGSIVSPAWINSVVGIRPTVGLVSRDGIIPISNTQDTAGPLTRTVTDAAITLGVLAGIDPHDPATQASAGKVPADYTQFLKLDGLHGKRLGIVLYEINPTDVDLAEAAFDALEQGGAELIDNIDISLIVIALGGLRGPEIPKTFSHEFAHGIDNYLASLGDNAPAKTLAEIVAFNRANADQAIPYGQDILEASLATGGDLSDPSYITERDEGIRIVGTDGIGALLDADNLDALVFPYNASTIGAIAGYPAIQVPAGFNADGEPFSLGFVGKPFSEPELIEIAFAFEQATLLRRPPLLLPGDINDDGTVDAADYVVLRNGLGTTYDEDDYRAWRANFGRTLTSTGAAQPPFEPPSTAVPEPTVLCLLTICWAMVAWCRSVPQFRRPERTRATPPSRLSWMLRRMHGAGLGHRHSRTQRSPVAAGRN
jgi:amidase